MKMNYVKSESFIKPELIDTTSSDTAVYIRRNITEKTIDDDNGNELTSYVYEEAKLTKEEYEEFLNEVSILDIRQQRADIDYIALMTGVDLEENV